MAKTIIRVQLEDAAKKRLDEVCNRRGMTQISVMSRLTEWFANQDDTTQALAMNQFSPETSRKLARKVLSNAAK